MLMLNVDRILAAIFLQYLQYVFIKNRIIMQALKIRICIGQWILGKEFGAALVPGIVEFFPQHC
jgi:hypothetical protein